MCNRYWPNQRSKAPHAPALRQLTYPTARVSPSPCGAAHSRARFSLTESEGTLKWSQSGSLTRELSGNPHGYWRSGRDSNPYRVLCHASLCSQVTELNTVGTGEHGGAQKLA